MNIAPVATHNDLPALLQEISDDDFHITIDLAWPSLHTGSRCFIIIACLCSCVVCLKSGINTGGRCRPAWWRSMAWPAAVVPWFASLNVADVHVSKSTTVAVYSPQVAFSCHVHRLVSSLAAVLFCFQGAFTGQNCDEKKRVGSQSIWRNLAVFSACA